MGIEGISGSGGMRIDSAQFAQKRFERLDADANGGIDKTEFSGIAEKVGMGVDELFTQYDVNEDGKLDQTEEAEVSANHKPKGPPPNGGGGMMKRVGQAGGSDTGFQELLEALSEETDEDENSMQSILQSLLQKSGASYGNSGLFSASSNVSTFNTIG